MRRAAPWVVAGLGGLLAVAGVVVFWLANTATWTVYGGSYAPLVPEGSPAAYQSRLVLGVDGSVLWTWRHAAGAGLLVLGLLLLAAVGGWALGRRSGRRDTSGPPA
ncbi:hypothetical protein GCU56_10945 [Geodermatophilus sabuli]|uniref:Uncharacterized protein n=1 Tax=Geodermatophilus sabuli TaxID=1564158 RepID=A0A7K3W181_9ACTN|nr:hypothetical protein [Geodermatophilus sabuli]NEK58388.1 hypothetical protein [Geodermatophilus sabuli]